MTIRPDAQLVKPQPAPHIVRSQNKKINFLFSGQLINAKYPKYYFFKYRLHKSKNNLNSGEKCILEIFYFAFFLGTFIDSKGKCLILLRLWRHTFSLLIKTDEVVKSSNKTCRFVIRKRTICLNSHRQVLIVNFMSETCVRKIKINIFEPVIKT